MPVHHTRRLMIPYPPADTWVAKIQDTYDWAEYMQAYTLADSSHRGYPVSLLETIKATDNALVVSLSSRGFTRQKLVNCVDEIVADATEVGKAVLLDDPGKMVPQNFAAGNLRMPVVDRVKNLQAKKFSAAFAAFWDLIFCKTNIQWVHYPDIPPSCTITIAGFELTAATSISFRTDKYKLCTIYT
ncbi:hypothetical protein BDZ91DRAFT_758645 [Kalaharituber pfeilii]|nr:hypothetical protein BDZ91DRAFT_758645 [Kalaharituber pfeilii]